MFPTFRDWERKVVDVEVGGMIFQVWIKIHLIYNPTNVALPINLQTPQTYTFQTFKLRKHTPTNPYKPILNLNHVIFVMNKNILYQPIFYFLFKMIKELNKQSVRFKTVYYCTSLNATRHHHCGNETKSDGLVLRKSASVFVT